MQHTRFTIKPQIAKEIRLHGDTPCDYCLGDGTIEVVTLHGYDLEPCPKCHARGYLDAGDLAMKEVAA